MFFAPTSFWNKPLPSNAALDPRSSMWMADLQQQLKIMLPTLNTTAYTTSIYEVPADAPTQKVTLEGGSYKPMQDQWLDVPIADDMLVAPGNDKNLVIWQPSTDTLWEFWKLHLATDGTGWHARWGGRMQGVSTNPGYFPAPFGASASSLPMAGGLVTIAEAQAGSINHALAMAIPHARKAHWVWPAQRTDGNLDSPDAIPEGTRLRLPASLNIAALNLPRITTMLAYAAQRYGIVIRDQAGSVAFVGEQSKDPTINPWTAIFAGVPGWKAIPAFPWAKLQALKAGTESPTPTT